MHRLAIILLLSSISLLPVKSQDFHVVTGKSVIIDGTTSFGKFSCTYEQAESRDTLKLQGQTNRNVLLDITLPVDEFGCGNKMLDRDFNKTLQADEFPHMRVQVGHFVFKEDKYESSLDLTLVGKRMMLENLPFVLKEEDGKSYLLANFEVNFSYFDIEPPQKFLGLLKVKEELRIDLRLDLLDFDQ